MAHVPKHIVIDSKLHLLEQCYVGRNIINIIYSDVHNRMQQNVSLARVSDITGGLQNGPDEKQATLDYTFIGRISFMFHDKIVATDPPVCSPTALPIKPYEHDMKPDII
jgi:hypothetical protein